MTRTKINRMLESTGGNLIVLKRIALDEKTPAEIRITAFLALNNKHKDHTVQAVYQDVESINQKLSIENNKLNV
ncbi:MAG TPA: hypothetical protein VLH59_00440 [Ignavibacteriaceae bacterium]|nr:hypothetical protein [Ignavibacteriaceae bacterium]